MSVAGGAFAPGPQPMVTVVTPVWSGESSGALARSLQSLIGQTFHSWDCVVVVDGPVPEHLEQVFDKFLRDPRISLLRLPESRGPAAARNAATAIARGRAVAILDADDWAEADRLSSQWEVLDRGGVDVVGSWVRLVAPSGEVLGERHVPVEDQEIKNSLWRTNPIPHSTVMMLTSIARRHPYREKLRYAEDYRLWLDLSRDGARFAAIPRCLVNYQVNPKGARHGGARHRILSVISTRVRALALYRRARLGDGSTPDRPVRPTLP